MSRHRLPDDPLRVEHGAFDTGSRVVRRAAIRATCPERTRGTGENDAALELLERSLITPAGVTVSSLKLNPIWDPLRSDARFQALVDIPQKSGVELSMNCR